MGIQEAKPRLTYQGLGDIRIGMTSNQVKKMGFSLNTQGPWGEEGDEEFIACHYLDSAPNYPGVHLMMSYDKLVRIDIFGGDWQSYSGAAIGMNEQEAEDIYGDALKFDYHPYAGKAGSYLSLQTRNRKYKMIFETYLKDDQLSQVDNPNESDSLDGPNKHKKITSFRAGLFNPTSYIEGCA